MTFQTIDIALPAGTCDAYLAVPEGDGPFPAILYGMDVGGLRPEIGRAIERIAARGYLVLAPNLFYRLGRAPVADMAELAQDMPRLFAMVATLTPEIMVADGDGYIEFLQRHPASDHARIGIVGYCMSGGMALRAAAQFSDRVAVAVSIHGANLATDTPDGAHLGLEGSAAEIYVGLAAEDPIMPEDQVARLVAALDQSGTRHQVETYPGTHHGFAVGDGQTYDAEQAERHWERLFELFERNL